MALACVLVGCLLIGVNLTGKLRGAVPGTSPRGRKPVDGYDYRQFPPAVALARYRDLERSGRPELEKIEALFHLVSGSVVHRKYRLNLFDNWLMRLAGFVRPELLNTQNARLLWTRGAGKCDQASLLLLAKAEELGIRGQILGLDGHVLVETECDRGKQVIDADMGCIWNCAYEELRSGDRADVCAAYITRGFTLEQAEHNARIIAETQNWHRFRFPPAERRYRLEILSDWLVWLLPCALILYGIFQ